MREFITAVKEVDPDEDDEGLAISIDGHVLRYYKPTDGQVAVYMASTGRHTSNDDRVAAIIDLFIGMFDDDGQTYLADRLRDRTDPFGVTNIKEILDAMMEEWSGRPTQPSSASTPSRTNGGRKSTRRTPVST